MVPFSVVKTEFDPKCYKTGKKRQKDKWFHFHACTGGGVVPRLRSNLHTLDRVSRRSNDRIGKLNIPKNVKNAFLKGLWAIFEQLLNIARTVFRHLRSFYSLGYPTELPVATKQELIEASKKSSFPPSLQRRWESNSSSFITVHCGVSPWSKEQGMYVTMKEGQQRMKGKWKALVPSALPKIWFFMLLLYIYAVKLKIGPRFPFL